MADSLVRAVDMRAAAAMWLLSERLPDWELAVVVISELHSAIEALWHGIDPMHPLHHLPSSVPAGQGLKAVYRAVDRLIGTFVQRFSDAIIVTFAAHGMGPNDSDVPGMLLLPELLYRKSFGRPLLREPSSWLNANNGVPLLRSNESWTRAVASALGERQSLSKLAHKVSRRLLRHWPANAKEAATSSARDGVEPTYRISVDWMPATKYRRHWPNMTAFALPAFYDGRVRLNLSGRERHGKVALERYSSTCDEVEALIRDCRDPRTGETIVSRLERCGGDNPTAIGPTEPDLFVEWRSAPLSLIHPTIGQIGPVPYRRTGGHTGAHGFAFVTGRGIAPGDYGLRSTFDIVPTLIELLGERVPSTLSGMTLFSTASERHCDVPTDEYH